MPFKSKAQMRWMFAAEKRGKVKKGTAKKWAEHTPNLKRLPTRIGKAMSKRKRRKRKKK